MKLPPSMPWGPTIQLMGLADGQVESSRTSNTKLSLAPRLHPIVGVWRSFLVVPIFEFPTPGSKWLGRTDELPCPALEQCFENEIARAFLDEENALSAKSPVEGLEKRHVPLNERTKSCPRFGCRRKNSESVSVSGTEEGRSLSTRIVLQVKCCKSFRVLQVLAPYLPQISREKCLPTWKGVKWVRDGR